MTPFLQGFTDELVKLGADKIKVDVDLEKAYRRAKRKGGRRHAERELSQLQRQRRESSNKYLTSMALGALAAPAAMLAGHRTRGALRRLFPKARVKPLQPMTVPQLGGGVARGALAGAMVQMLRDRAAAI